MSEKMPYELKVTFKGLCAFVYDSKHKVMNALLVDGHKPGSSERFKKHYFVHIPTVRFNVDDLVNGEEWNKFNYVSGNAKQGVWILDGDDLKFRFHNPDREPSATGINR